MHVLFFILTTATFVQPSHRCPLLSLSTPAPRATLSFLKYQFSALHINRLRSFPSSRLLLPLSPAQVACTPGLHISSSFLSLKSWLKCLLLKNASLNIQKLKKIPEMFIKLPYFNLLQISHHYLIVFLFFIHPVACCLSSLPKCTL